MARRRLWIPLHTCLLSSATTFVYDRLDRTTQDTNAPGDSLPFAFNPSDHKRNSCTIDYT